MIRITNPLHIRDPLNHIAKGDAITQIQQPLAGLVGRVPLRSDAGNDSSAGCHLQLFTSLNALEESGQVLPQIGNGDKGHAQHSYMYKTIVHEQRGDGLVRGGGSILTTTYLARFRQNVFKAALAEQIHGSGASENRMGL